MLSRLRPSWPEVLVWSVVASIGWTVGKEASSLMSTGELSVVTPSVLKMVN